MVPVLLLGELGKKFGRRVMLDVKSPAEAIRALCANFPGFEKFVTASGDRGVAYRVLAGKQDVGVDELHDPSGRHAIKIVPVVAGAGGMVKAIIGAVLIAAAIFYPPLAAVALPMLGANATLATVAFSIGVSLTLGGIAEMLAPQPPGIADDPQKPSYAFSGAVNTTAQGQPVPVGYGRMIVGSAVISAGMNVEDFNG